ncbi:hypothetical protein M3Y97_00449800 [Aphelenchoides bicaudatus]|nr:hypothetical protein M3Y97_00449800 [Aphelenchoides bicaudatus]
MNNYKTDRNQNYSYDGEKTSPKRVQNGAIASLVAPQASSSSREQTPSTSSFSPPLSGSRAFLNSPPHHLHLPTYRFVDEDSRPKSALGHAADCQRCGLSRRRNNTWLEIEAAYDLIDRQNKADLYQRQMSNVAEKRSHFEAAARLQKASNELDRLLDELESFGGSSTAASRSKSTPDFNYLNGPSHSPQNDFRLLPPPAQSRYFYKLRKEELLRRQRADKLALEIEDQKNRRHGYLPNLSPKLQDDFSRLERLLNDFRPIEPNGRSTPITNGTSSSIRSRSLSSHSLRPPLPLGHSRNMPLTCTAIHKFVAESPRELSLEVGDLIYMPRRIDENWLEGERHGFIGIFPASFVRFNV